MNFLVILHCTTIFSNKPVFYQCGAPVADSLAIMGYTVFGWDMEWPTDSIGRMTRTAREMIGEIERLVQQRKTFTPMHLVILFHDPMLNIPQDRTALLEFIRKVKEMSNFRFEHLSHYPNKVL